MATEITVIPLPEAAKRLCISPDVLTRIAQDGTLKLKIKTCDGQIMIDQEEVRRMAKALALRDRIWKQVAKFEDETIGTDEAKTEFGITPPTLYLCIKKGYIRADNQTSGGRGVKRRLNKADVAYVAELSRRGRGRGHRLFTSDTLPPHLDHINMGK